MKFDLVLAGVGGQGVVSTAIIVARAATAEKLYLRQSEVHGMAQRGGSVQAQVRIADTPVNSSLVMHGRADCIIGFEPVEGLRTLAYLYEGGRYITSVDPIPTAQGYPDELFIKNQLGRIPGAVLVNAKELARKAGNSSAINVVLLGVASVYMDMIAPETFEMVISETFGAEGDSVVSSNMLAFRLGREYLNR